VLEGLGSGRIGALGLDVQWQEPFDPEDPVAKHPRHSLFSFHTLPLFFSVPASHVVGLWALQNQMGGEGGGIGGMARASLGKGITGGFARHSI